MDYSNGAKKIAKNTLLLYVRMAVLLLVGLYTSRVVLGALGESDYGVYNVVGGVVAMFSIISGALSSAISRFITFELGRRGSRLGAIFRCAVFVQIVLALIVVAVGEPLGLWFIGEKMTIPPERVAAAQIVLQFSLITFVINLLSVPYNATIIAHESMGAFAAVGLLEGFAKLGVALLLSVSPIDRMVWYALLMCVVALCVRLAYVFYCRRHFDECRRTRIKGQTFGMRQGLFGTDASILKEMFSFAGWNFIGVSAGVLKDQGGNILINLYSPSPAVNAGRGIAMQLSNAVQGFVTNFMTAVNPQITKSYASGEFDYMHRLVRKSSKFSYFLILFFALPLIFETDWLLGLWLKEIPEYAPVFVRLLLVLVLSDSLSNSLITMQLATGNIKRYQLIVGGILLLNIPVSWVLLACGLGVEWVVVVAIVLSQTAMFARLFLLRGMVGLNVGLWLRDVWFRAIAVTVYACVPIMLPGVLGLHLHPLLVVLLAMCSAVLAAWLRGCTSGERKSIIVALKARLPLHKKVGFGLGSFVNRPLRVYAATNRDAEILRQSSSGGVFNALAGNFIREGGTVCAAVWDEDFRGVHHAFAEDEVSLAAMMRSKYVQSSIGGCFLKIRDMLAAGRSVMFVGTPCQVRALKTFIGRENISAANVACPESVGGQLLLVEILCHGAPLPATWRRFVDAGIATAGAVSVCGVNFRDKSVSGWKDYHVTIDYLMPDGSVSRLSQPYMKNEFMQDFLADKNLRDSCYDCKAKNGRSGADISLGDFWGVERLFPKAYNRLGVSVVSVFTERGARAVEDISASLKLTDVPEDVFERSIKCNGGYGIAGKTARKNKR